MTSVSVFVVILLFLLAFSIYVIRGIADDARARGKSPVPVILLCVLCFPLGLLIWVVFRPEPLESSKQPFRLEDQRVQ
jgi:hypothetical protein